MSEPCSLFLWRRGRWSGPILEVLGRCTGHIRSYALLGSSVILKRGVAVDVPVTVG